MKVAIHHIVQDRENIEMGKYFAQVIFAFNQSYIRKPILYIGDIYICGPYISSIEPLENLKIKNGDTVHFIMRGSKVYSFAKSLIFLMVAKNTEAMLNYNYSRKALNKLYDLLFRTIEDPHFTSYHNLIFEHKRDKIIGTYINYELKMMTTFDFSKFSQIYENNKELIHKIITRTETNDNRIAFLQIITQNNFTNPTEIGWSKVLKKIKHYKYVPFNVIYASYLLSRE